MYQAPSSFYFLFYIPPVRGCRKMTSPAGADLVRTSRVYTFVAAIISPCRWELGAAAGVTAVRYRPLCRNQLRRDGVWNIWGFCRSRAKVFFITLKNRSRFQGPLL